MLHDILFAQLSLIWLQCTLALFVNEYARPFKTNYQRVMELFNETILYLMLLNIMCFSDFVPSIQMKVYLGYVACGLVTFHFAFNLALMVYFSLRDTKKTIKLKVARRKYLK